MAWKLLLTKPAQKNLQRISNPDHDRLVATLRAMEDDPYHGDVTFLRNISPALRRRVGNWRILFDLDTTQQLIIVHAITRRTTTTYRKR